MRNEFCPKLFTLIRKKEITKKQLMNDILSGIIVGIVALPLAIAFAIASGVSPDKGLITAIIAGFIVSVLGGSRVQIGGPTGAFIVIVYGIVQQYGVSGLIISTFLAGFMLVGFGLARLGNYLKFIPHPLIVGFTSGIALIIFSGQIKDFFGFSIEKIPPDFIDQWLVYSRHFHQFNIYSLLIGFSTVFIMVIFHKLKLKIPGSIVAILLTTSAAVIFQLPVETIETKFGEIPNTITLPAFPDFNYEIIRSLIQPAFAIAVLGAIESLLSAVVADGMTGGKHRSNMELIAQGMGNIFSALFGGIPATGAIARTATNIKNGGKTPVSGIVHAITLLLIMLIFAPLAKKIPLSCLAGILVVVAYNMSEWRQFKSILKSKSMDVIVLLSTFFLTVIFDLVIAIEIGIVLSSLLFMKRMSESFMIKNAVMDDDREEKLFQNELERYSDRIMIYEISGPLFFGAARQFQDTLSNLDTKPDIVILRARYVPFIDSTGFYRFKELIRTFYSQDIIAILSGVSADLNKEFIRNGMYDIIDEDKVFFNVQDALKHAKEILK